MRPSGPRRAGSRQSEVRSKSATSSGGSAGGDVAPEAEDNDVYDLVVEVEVYTLTAEYADCNGRRYRATWQFTGHDSIESLE